MKYGNILETLTDIVFPKICPICARAVPLGWGSICPECAGKLTFVREPYCMRCSKPVDEDEEYCRDCTERTHVYDEGCAALIYDEYMSKSIYGFKYNGKTEYARFYADVMAEVLGDRIRRWDPDAIIPVPIHKSKLKKRGYNQAHLLSKELSKRLSIPVKSDIVTRQSATKVQKNLSAAARQNNLKKAFNVIQNSVKLNSVLIVDDIYTTGATVDAMAGCLKDAGVKNVYFAALCIGRGM